MVFNKRNKSDVGQMADCQSLGLKIFALSWFCALRPPVLPRSAEGWRRKEASDCSHINFAPASTLLWL